MRIGILADIHENVELLREVLERFEQLGVDQVLLLGDIAYNGRRIEETVDLLQQHDPIGVWGNHDMGLACSPNPKTIERFSPAVIDFFSKLESKLIIDGLFFSHGLPTWDAYDPGIFYTGNPPYLNSVVKDQFDHSEQQIIIVGHFHRWYYANDCTEFEWNGSTEIAFAPTQKYFVIVEAVFNGGFAIIDTKSKTLFPGSITN